MGVWSRVECWWWWTAGDGGASAGRLGFETRAMGLRHQGRVRRHETNGDQYERMTADALMHPKSRNWCGYWQRAVA